VRLFVLARHGQSTLNRENRVNGDPTRPAPLTEAGQEQARTLGLQLTALSIDLCLHTRFPRTRETAELALGERRVPMETEPLLDDIDVGELEGLPIAEYRAWKHVHRERSDPFPGGESLDDAAGRYARAFEALLARGEQVTLVVCHEIPVRYALNAAAGSDELDGPAHDIPNATAFLFDEPALERAASRIASLAATREAS
jgi:broad specificity phosphatase PhoE